LSALKLAIDVKGFPAVEKALRGLTDSKSILDGLEDLLKSCVGDSFAPDTRVLLADGRTEPIADIRVGDKVLATDPRTGVTGAEPVTALHENLDTDFADVTINGDQAVRTTQHHPFWNATTQSWTDAGDLRPGDALLGRAGSATVTRVERYTGARTMHNLTVADLHTYYVIAGGTPVLVHNCVTIKTPPNGFSYYHAETKSLFEVSLDADGDLTMLIFVPKTGAPYRGSELFEMMWDHLGSRVKSITGNFIDDNRDSFNAAYRANGGDKEAAAWTTWTGKMASRHGFTKLESVYTEGPAGDFTKIEARFVKP
jgi:hypothetical protein